MSEIESKVKAIIVDKLGVDEAEVKPEASFTLRRSVLLATLSLTSRRTQNKYLYDIGVVSCSKQPLCFNFILWN